MLNLKHFPRARYLVAPLLFLTMIIILLLLTNQLSILVGLGNILAYLLKNGSHLIILALGAGLVLAAGGVDISGAGVATIGGIVFAIASHIALALGIDFYLSIIIALTLSLIIGFISGSFLAFFIDTIKAPALIASWAVGALWILVSLVFASPDLHISFLNNLGRQTSSIQLPFRSEMEVFQFHGYGFNILFSLIISTIIILHFSNLPRLASAVGSNRDSANFSGIRSKKVIKNCYILNGIMSSMAGITYTFINNSATTTGLSGIELTAIAIAILGGTSMSGGFFKPIPIVFSGLFWGEVFLFASTINIVGNQFQSQIANSIFSLTFIVVLFIVGRRVTDNFAIIQTERKTEDK